MSTKTVTPESIHAYLRQHQEKELCRFVTVGSVDDGKSTLIGRLLHDTHGIYEDQLDAVRKATKQEGGEIDFSLFTDGLKAEREQGITIDVAYRYFSTENRKFIIADTPGHLQYTRNMATGASTANVAVILIDARLGVLQQSRRHAYIASLLGIPHLAVCVNKMDLEDYREEVFDKIRAEFSAFCSSLRFKEVKFIPISAKLGHNVVHDEGKTSWYKGGTILEYLEQVPVRAGINEKDFRYPIQYVLRPNLNYRGFSGTIASGSVNKGDTLMSLPSRKTSKVLSIDTFDGELASAAAPMAVTIRLEDEIDSSRGDMLVKPDNLPEEVQRFDAKVVWMGEHALDRGRTYLVKHTSQLVRVDVEKVQFLVDLETLEEKPANRIELNDIGQVTFSAHKAMFVDPYRENSVTGAFILIDPLTNNTVAAGMIEGPAKARGIDSLATDVELPVTLVDADERRRNLGQRGGLIVLTGLPCSGKSELAYAIERKLADQRKHALVVDPDDGLARALPLDGSAPPSTSEFVHRTTHSGFVALLSFALPLRADREALRDVVGKENFCEIYVSTALDECKSRDVRGAYGPNRPDPAYEVPRTSDLSIDLARSRLDEAASQVVNLVREKGFLSF
jgi:bifunctional enzyme CysN/CysC